MQCGCCRPLVDAARPVASLHWRHSIALGLLAGLGVFVFSFADAGALPKEVPEEVPEEAGSFKAKERAC